MGPEVQVSANAQQNLEIPLIPDITGKKWINAAVQESTKCQVGTIDEYLSFGETSRYKQAFIACCAGEATLQLLTGLLPEDLTVDKSYVYHSTILL